MYLKYCTQFLPKQHYSKIKGTCTLGTLCTVTPLFFRIISISHLSISHLSSNLQFHKLKSNRFAMPLFSFFEESGLFTYRSAKYIKVDVWQVGLLHKLMQSAVLAFVILQLVSDNTWAEKEVRGPPREHEPSRHSTPSLPADLNGESICGRFQVVPSTRGEAAETSWQLRKRSMRLAMQTTGTHPLPHSLRAPRVAIGSR